MAPPRRRFDFHALALDAPRAPAPAAPPAPPGFPRAERLALHGAKSAEDWALGTRLQVRSARDLAWTRRGGRLAGLALVERSAGGEAKSRKRKAFGLGAVKKPLAERAVEDFAAAQVFWSHPGDALPVKWAQAGSKAMGHLGPEDWAKPVGGRAAHAGTKTLASRSNSVNSAMSASQSAIAGFVQQRLKVWETTFQDLVHAWLREAVPNFYVCAPSILPEAPPPVAVRVRNRFGPGLRILFRHGTEPLAVLSASTASLQDALKGAGVAFRLLEEDEERATNEGPGDANLRRATTLPDLDGRTSPEASSMEEAIRPGRRGVLPSIVVEGEDDCLGLAEVLAEAVLLSHGGAGPGTSGPMWTLFESFGCVDVPQLLAPTAFLGGTMRSLRPRFCGRTQQSDGQRESGAGTALAASAAQAKRPRLARSSSVGNPFQVTSSSKLNTLPKAELEDDKAALVDQEFLLELVGPVLPGVAVRLAKALHSVLRASRGADGDAADDEDLAFTITSRPDVGSTCFNGADAAEDAGVHIAVLEVAENEILCWREKHDAETDKSS